MTPEQRGQSLLERLRGANRSRRAKLADDARALASQLHREGVDLCMSKATEHSPRIRVLFRLASQLAVYGFGPDAPELGRFRQGLSGDATGRARFDALRKSLG